MAAGKSADDIKVVDVLAELRLYYIKKQGLRRPDATATHAW